MASVWKQGVSFATTTDEPAHFRRGYSRVLILRKYAAFALALALFCGFWGLALTGSFPPPHGPENQTVSRSSAPCTTHDCRQDAASEGLSFYTAVLAWFTGVLAAVSFVQGIFLYRADRAARKASDISTATTERRMDLEEKQFLLEGQRADLAERQHGLLRLQFLATNRPELVIREVFWTTLTEDGTAVVSFTLINRGQSRGRVVESAIEVRNDNPITQFQANGANSLGDIALAPGEFCFRQVRVDQFLAGGRGLQESFLRGLIVYEDDTGIRRRLVFCRRAAAGGDRFFPLGDREYEYTD